MTRTPDVIVFGGSRFELATPDLFPGRTFYNGFVHNDVFRTSSPFPGCFYEHKRLPKNLVLTVRSRPSCDRPALRETDEFKLFCRSTDRWLNRLGIEKEILARRPSPGLLVASAVGGQHRKARLVPARWKAARSVDAATLDDMDVIHAAGSMAFSKEHSASFRTILLSRGVTNMFSNADTIDQIPSSERPR